MGYNITNIAAERKNMKNPVQKIDVNSTPYIKHVEERDVTFVNKETALAIGFEFITIYSPNIGEIRINGEIMYTTNDTKKVVKHWNKEKKLPDDVETEVKNFLFRKCLGIGIDLSEDMQLPPPLGFPVLVKEEPKEDTTSKYIG